MKRAISFILSCLLVGLSLGCGSKNATPSGESASDAPAIAKSEAADAERIEGLWQAMGGEANGAAVPPDALKKIRVRIDKGTLQTLFDGKPNSPKNRIKLLTDTKPKGVDLLADEGGEKGQVRDGGIYEFDGERLKLCIHEGGPEKGKERVRPLAFKSEKGSKLVFLVLERVKE